MKQLDQFIQDSGGIVSVSELAGFLELDEGAVRSWARGHGLRRIGATFSASKSLSAQAPGEERALLTQRVQR